MSRTAATLPRPTPHRPVADPDNVGCCLRCHLIFGAGLHQPQQIAEWEAQQAAREAELAEQQREARRRVGDA